MTSESTAVSRAEEPMTISLSRPHSSFASPAPASAASKEKTNIVPLSLPAILRNPKSRLAHLASQPPKAKSSKDALSASGIVGKRRRRRFENALLSSNPHILRPSNFDLLPRPAPGIPTFSPRPTSFPSSVIIPSNELLVGTPNVNGQFGFSLKGVRRALRRSGSEGGARARDVVEIVEASLRSWLSQGGKRASDFYVRAVGPGGRVLDSTPYLASSEVEEMPAIVELSRLPHALLWTIPDPYDRFIVHCVARYYNIVSFSADDTRAGGSRVTHLLRPNMVRPSNVGLTGETPPGTDLSATEGETSAFESAGETDASEMGDGDSDWDVVAPSEGEVEIDPSIVSTGYSTDEADADVGTDDDAASELEASLVDLRLASVVSADAQPRITSQSPFISLSLSSSPARPAFFPSPSVTPRPSSTDHPSTSSTPSTQTPRARRTRASFPPASSRIREEAVSENFDIGRSRALRYNYNFDRAWEREQHKEKQRTGALLVVLKFRAFLSLSSHMSLPVGAFSPVAKTSVRDSEEEDWETAYSRDEPQQTESSRNAKLWSDANINAPQPSYTLLNSSTSSRLPPPAALAPQGPALTILKRPSSAASDAASRNRTPGGREEKTLLQREKEYEAARRRIYGESSTPSPTTTKDDPLAKGLKELSIGSGSRSGSRGSGGSSSPRGGRGQRGGGSRSSSSTSLVGGPDKGTPPDVVRTPRGPGVGRGGFGGESVQGSGAKTAG
ncbi:hypothetical protein P7C70_g1742, partial [Phenoliferia sp. Uapishka_3]